jgi:hypothetical protein
LENETAIGKYIADGERELERAAAPLTDEFRNLCAAGSSPPTDGFEARATVRFMADEARPTFLLRYCAKWTRAGRRRL